MAVPQAVLVSLLPFQEADPSQRPGWWQTMGRGITDFLTVERVRDAVVVVIAAGLYYWLAKRAQDRLILTPMRTVVAQELTSIGRLGVEGAHDLDDVIKALTTPAPGVAGQEEAIIAGLTLKGDLATAARLRELSELTTSALIASAAAVKGSLHPPALAYLEKATLSDSDAEDLRCALAVVSTAKAKRMLTETRLALRRIRKSQSLGVAGLLLLVLLVIMFGNPAIVAFGVLGAMVSRLIAFFRASTDTDQKYNWVILFLVPIVGGLSAYGGVLLIDAMRTWGLLGETFAGVDFGGEHANVPTMAAAFLFGFVERLLDNVAGNAIDGLGAVAKRESEAEAAGAAASGEAGIEPHQTPDGGEPGPGGDDAQAGGGAQGGDDAQAGDGAQGAGEVQNPASAQNDVTAAGGTAPSTTTQTTTSAPTPTTATPAPPDEPVELLEQHLPHEDSGSGPNR